MFAPDFPPLHGTLLDLAGYCLLVFKGRALACVSVGNEGFFFVHSDLFCFPTNKFQADGCWLV